jgi:diguanylate cyclase (GGDEF)-like protein/PAS domain S-box-containing protein
MNLLDVRTVMVSYIISNAINTVVLFFLWRQNRKRFAGIGFWLADYLMQFVAVLLVGLRGVVPDSVSAILGNGLIVAGTILLYIGLEKFVGKRGPQWHNALLLAAFLAVHTYFLFVHPDLAARSINLEAGLLILCLECAWLMLRRIDPELRPIARGAGYIFAALVLVNAVRILADITTPIGNDFLHSNIYDTLAVLAYQMLFIALTFNVILMVNRRLFIDLDRDITVRRQIETALRESEEKFSKAFHADPDAILISRVSDGRLLEVNEGFSRLTEYSRAEALSSSSILLSLWAQAQDREACLAALRKDGSVHDREYDFRIKPGRILHCLYSGEIINLGGEAHIVSIVRDITGRKQAEEVLRRSEANFREVFDNSAQGIFIIDVLEDGKFRIQDSNPAQEKDSGVRRADVRGKLVEEAFPSEMAKLVRSNYVRCVEGGIPIAVDEEIELPVGRRSIHTTLAPVRDDTGRIYRIIGSTMDISQRKRIEEILRLRLNLWEFAAGHTVDELMQKALDEIEKLTGSPIGFYHFVEEDQKTLSLQAWSTRTLKEFCTAQGSGTHYAIDQAGVWADCIRERKPLIHNDYAALPNRKGMPAGHAEVVRELVVPTLRAGRVVSVLGIGNKPAAYDEKDVELVVYIADIVWVIVDRKRTEEEILRLQAQLREMAIHDPLTGLYNRRFLNETLQRELARGSREKYPVSFVMIDIDNFKLVNDTFGHAAGDAVLQDLAALLRKNTRGSDIVYRYGGEEFLAVLPKAKAENALLVAEKWRKGFQESAMLLQYGGAKTSISCGIAAFPRHGLTGADLLACADQALYQAKTAGRNRSVIWKNPPAKIGAGRGKGK